MDGIVGDDTLVVVRLLVGLPSAQFEQARQRLDRAHAAGEVVLVADLVVAEALHVLRHHDEVPEPEIGERLLELLRSGLVHAGPADLAAVVEEAPAPGLIDRLIHLKRLRERRAGLADRGGRARRAAGAAARASRVVRQCAQRR